MTFTFTLKQIRYKTDTPEGDLVFWTKKVLHFVTYLQKKKVLCFHRFLKVIRKVSGFNERDEASNGMTGLQSLTPEIDANYSANLHLVLACVDLHFWQNRKKRQTY